MAIFTLTDAVIWADSLDLTGVSNKVTLKVMTNEKDATVFGGGGYKVRLGGLEDVEVNASGYLDVNSSTTTSQDALTSAMLGAANKVFTIAPTSPATSIAYIAQAAPLSYDLLGAAPGDIAPFNLVAKGSNALPTVRGQIAAAKQTVSAVGAVTPTTGVLLGAGAAGKFLYAAVHMFLAPTTITLQVQSATTNAFSSPTVRATIGPLTVSGGVFMARVDASAITDTWYRLNVSAITGSAVLSGALAVQ